MRGSARLPLVWGSDLSSQEDLRPVRLVRPVREPILSRESPTCQTSPTGQTLKRIRLSADTIRMLADTIKLSADSLIVFWAFSKGEKNGLFLYSVCFSQRIENYALLRKSLQGNDERKVLGNKQKELGKV